MTEAEWLACEDLAPMLDFLRGRASERKLRLFACACCRLVWRLLKDERSRRAVEISELFADGAATSKQLAVAERLADEAADLLGFEADVSARMAKRAARDAAQAALLVARKQVVPARVSAKVNGAITFTSLRPVNPSALLRDLFGNPYRPVAIDPGWLAWNGGTARKLAQAIYEERAFDRMPILADALEDAGCTDPDLLAHCRGPGPHVRGCWAVDLLLDNR
jgi:hypothetical protein